jgi:hypothetical protein
MLGFIKKLFGLQQAPVAKAPYKVEKPVELHQEIKAQSEPKAVKPTVKAKSVKAKTPRKPKAPKA